MSRFTSPRPGRRKIVFCLGPGSHLHSHGWSVSPQGAPTEQTYVLRILVYERFLLIRMNTATTGLLGNQPRDGSHRPSGGRPFLESGFDTPVSVHGSTHLSLTSS